MLRYPPDELSWEEVWKDAYVSAMQINTPESREMADRQHRCSHQLRVQTPHSASAEAAASSPIAPCARDAVSVVIASVVLQTAEGVTELPPTNAAEGYMKRVSIATASLSSLSALSTASRRSPLLLRGRCAWQWLTAPLSSPEAASSVQRDEAAMFDDEDIGVHVTSYTARPQPYGAPPRFSSSSSRSTRPSSSSAHVGSDDFSSSDSDGGGPSSHRTPSSSSPAGGGRPRGRAAAGPVRHLIPHSPHCASLGKSVNRPFVCIWPDTVDGRGRRSGDEADGPTAERCQADFPSRQACENHIRSRHTKEKLACSYGGCVFSTHDVQNLSKHERNTHREAPQRRTL